MIALFIKSPFYLDCYFRIPKMLKVERNYPGPCGSGKKFKKYCGVSLAPVQPDFITTNRAVAYRGAVGRRIEAFCQDYTALKRAKSPRWEM